MNEIRWKLDPKADRVPFSFGRNGYMQTVGIVGYTSGPDLHLYPINTKGVGRCRISIHFEEIDNFIELLKSIKKQEE